jgi:hypothetical protein
MGMSRKIFERYWNDRYADAPDGQPHSDPNVPYEHLQKYNGKEVGYYFIGDGFSCDGSGKLKADNVSLLIFTMSGHVNIGRDKIQEIAWLEDKQLYSVKTSAGSLAFSFKNS